MISIVTKSKSLDSSIKYVFSDDENNEFEAIYFSKSERVNKLQDPYSICISTQAGCAMGCKFCATAYGGFYKNLSPRSMFEQVQLIRNDVISRNIELPSNPFEIVVMGMGEPFMNYDNLIQFLYEGKKQFLTLVHYRISTVGITSKIRDIACHRENVNFFLYLSVHSPFEKEREYIMPITKKFSLLSSIDACRSFYDRTKVGVKGAYLLLDGLNDSVKHAKALASILDKEIFTIQILMYNNTPGLPFSRTSEAKVKIFTDILLDLGHKAYVRISHGRDIDAGCGQFVRLNSQMKGKHASQGAAS